MQKSQSSYFVATAFIENATLEITYQQIETGNEPQIEVLESAITLDGGERHDFDGCFTDEELEAYINSPTTETLSVSIYEPRILPDLTPMPDLIPTLQKALKGKTAVRVPISQSQR